jgi:hypothetical protein
MVEWRRWVEMLFVIYPEHTFYDLEFQKKTQNDDAYTNRIWVDGQRHIWDGMLAI